MLRRKLPSGNSAETGTTCPSATEPFVLGHGLAGVHFYGLKETFYLSYGTLEAMRLGEETLTLIFATDEVVIEGRGLHALYVHLAEQKVRRVHEQGERYEEVCDSPVFIQRIQRQSRTMPP